MFLGRVPAKGEPIWLDDDRAWAMALLAEERGTHDACGQPIDLAFDPATEDRWRADHGAPCYACRAIAMRSEGDPPDLSYHVHLLPLS